MKTIAKVLIIALLVAVLLPAGAYAAQGDAVLALRSSTGFDDYVNSSCVTGDTLYLFGGAALYTWHLGEPDLTAYPWENGTMYSYTTEYDPETGDTIYSNRYPLGVFAYNGEACCVMANMHGGPNGNQTDSVMLQRVVLKDGVASFEDIRELDWEPLMEYYDSDSNAKSFESGSAVIGDTLYCMVYGDGGDNEIYAVPLDGGYSEQIEAIEFPYSLCVYKDGMLLFEQYDYNDYTVARFCTYDPASDSVSTLLEITVPEYSPMSSVIYGAERDRVYYSEAGYLVALDLATGETERVNSLSVSSYGGGGAMMMDGGFYVLTGYEATLVRNTDPAQQAEYSLSVYNGAYADCVQATYYDFSNVRGDVSVAISSDYIESSQIVSAMMNRSADTDIYVLSMFDTAFDAVFTRGYMAELDSSEKINAYIDSMYPSLQDSFRMNGTPVCVPVYCYGSTIGLNVNAMESAGIDSSSLPTNWLDFLDFLNTLPELLADTNVSAFYAWSTQAECKNQLLNIIIDDYQKYLNYAGLEIGYDTDILRQVLTKLDQVDFAALGLPETIDYESDNYWGYSDGEVLIEPGQSCVIGDYYSGSSPLLLSMTPDTPRILQLYVQAAFVNPFSANRDIAIEFLERLIDNVPLSVRYNMSDEYNEPIRSSYYQESIDNTNQEIEELKQAIADAEGAEKQELEEMLGYYADTLADIDANSWEISPASIEFYRANDDYVLAGGYNPFYNDGSGEIYDLMSQYAYGSLSMDQFLKSVQQKVQMMVLEGN